MELLGRKKRCQIISTLICFPLISFPLELLFIFSLSFSFEKFHHEWAVTLVRQVVGFIVAVLPNHCVLLLYRKRKQYDTDILIFYPHPIMFYPKAKWNTIKCSIEASIGRRRVCFRAGNVCVWGMHKACVFVMNRGTHPAPAAALQAMEFLQRDNVSQPEQLAPKIHPNTHTLTHIFCGIGYQRWMESSFFPLGQEYTCPLQDNWGMRQPAKTCPVRVKR